MIVNSWKETLAWSAFPLLGVMLLNVLLETPQSLQSLNASQGPSIFLAELSNDGVLSEESTDPEIPSFELPQAPEGTSYRYERSVVAKVTGYTPGVESCGIFADGITSTGRNAWSLWGVAADPSLLPYGTLVFIPGVGYREVDDTGSAMREAWRNRKETHIDLRFQDLTEAKIWGVRQLPVHIFVPEKL
jgi:3D (Asp-Asp-Asp) domain-containing protein